MAKPTPTPPPSRLTPRGDRTSGGTTTSAQPPRPTAALAGATGLVGTRCAEALASSGHFADVVTLVRRTPAATPTGVRPVLVDFATLATQGPTILAEGATTAGAPPITAALCALGTTIKTAGSQNAFRAVDHDAVLAFAVWARTVGATRFVLVSSVGADATSSNFYLRVKGETEAALAKVGFPRLVILRPSFLRGPRAERRVGEIIAATLLPIVDPFLRGPWRRYHSIDADSVARAMVVAAASDEAGHHVWDHDEIVRQSVQQPPQHR